MYTVAERPRDTQALLLRSDAFRSLDLGLNVLNRFGPLDLDREDLAAGERPLRSGARLRVGCVGAQGQVCNALFIVFSIKTV